MRLRRVNGLNTKKVKLIVDVDGTLCPIKNSNERYEDLQPNLEMVNKLREYQKGGATIVLYTSRNMNSYQENLGIINVKTAPILLEWLKKWDIPFDELLLGKPWPSHFGFYVDDRAVRPLEFLNNSLEELEQICNNDRIQEGSVE